MVVSLRSMDRWVLGLFALVLACLAAIGCGGAAVDEHKHSEVGDTSEGDAEVAGETTNEAPAPEAPAADSAIDAGDAAASLLVTPWSASAPAGGPDVSYKATLTLSDGSTVNVTTGCVWSSSDVTVATIGAATGIAKPIKTGTATITADYKGTKGSATLTVTSDITSIVVTPTSASLSIGLTQAFTATAILSSGASFDATSSVTWTSSNLTVVTMTGSSALAVGKGTSIITASDGVVSGTATVTVGAPCAVAIAVTPGSPSTISKGGTVDFKAIATMSGGTTLDVTSTATWKSTPSGIVTFAGGVATGISYGTTTVTASLCGKTSPGSTVYVISPDPKSLMITPSPPAPIPIGGTTPLTCTLTWTDSTTSDITSTGASWASSAPTIASASSKGIVIGNVSGSADITCSFAGLTSPIVTVTVAPASVTLVSISLAPTGPLTMIKGSTQSFVATGFYSSGITSDVTASTMTTWEVVDTSGTSSGSLTVSTGVVKAIDSTCSGGTCVAHQVRARQGPIIGGAAVTVKDPTISSIALTCAGPLTCIPDSVGYTVACTAIVTHADSTTTDMTSTIGWSSSVGAVASYTSIVSGKAIFTVGASGTTAITATTGGVTSTSVTLSAAAMSLSTLAVSGTSPLASGATAPYTATGTFTSSVSACSGLTRDLTNATSLGFSSSTTATATISNAAASKGLVTALAAGTTAISAAVGTTTGSQTLTVSP